MPEISHYSFDDKQYTTIEQAINEVRKYCIDSDLLDRESLIEFIYAYLDLLPKEQHKQYKDLAIELLYKEFEQRMPYPTDIIRIDKEMGIRLNRHNKLNMPWRFGGKDKEIRKITVVQPTVFVPRPKPKTNTSDIQGGLNGIETDTDGHSFIDSTIDEYLCEFNGDAINSKEYNIVIAVLSAFFHDEPLPKHNAVFVKYGNKKKLASALGGLFKGLMKEPISYEYLTTCKLLFECYNSGEVVKDDIFKSTLYKYLTIKSQ